MHNAIIFLLMTYLRLNDLYSVRRGWSFMAGLTDWNLLVVVGGSGWNVERTNVTINSENVVKLI